MNSVSLPEEDVNIYKKLSFLYGICFNMAIEGRFFCCIVVFVCCQRTFVKLQLKTKIFTEKLKPHQIVTLEFKFIELYFVNIEEIISKIMKSILFFFVKIHFIFLTMDFSLVLTFPAVKTHKSQQNINEKYAGSVKKINRKTD
jgi:hypothetical protein